MKSAVIFGGSGFIGCFFAKHLVDNCGYKKIFLYDHNKIIDASIFRNNLLKNYEEIIEVSGDVRESIKWQPNEKISLIANFAAVHREPGHEDFEYFHTNLNGAENVCKWAEEIKCNQIIFSSSIAPYGISSCTKNESTIPVPVTSYGSSKLVAEKIHQTWKAKDSAHSLLIIRPGVVFGPSEGGNVSRLIKAVSKGYFFYMGNKQTIKAGIYIHELCQAITWLLECELFKSEKEVLANLCMEPGPTLEDYVNAIMKINSTKKYIFNIPKSLLLITSYFISFILKPFSISHPFDPLRIKKLDRPNNITPSFLIKNGYTFKYNLIEALEDWKNSSPKEWL